jgi:hypothetical protein
MESITHKDLGSQGKLFARQERKQLCGVFRRTRAVPGFFCPFASSRKSRIVNRGSCFSIHDSRFTIHERTRVCR